VAIPALRELWARIWLGRKSLPAICTSLKVITTGKKTALFLSRDENLVRELSSYGEVAVYSGDEKDAFSQDLLSRHFKMVSDIGENNAEVIFLAGNARRTLAPKKLKHALHAEFIVVRNDLALPAYSYFLRRHLIRNRLRTVGFLCDNEWIVFKNLRREIGPRFYFPSDTSPHGFFECLDGLDYCILRGAPPSSAKHAKEDFAILVNNAHAAELAKRVTKKLGFSPVEIYSPFSMPGHAPKNRVSYIPPLRALEILRDSTLDATLGARRSTSRDRLLSHCYDLLFHEKEISPGPNGETVADTWPGNKFEELNRLSDAADRMRFSRLTQIEDFLRQHKWFPPAETLAFLARDSAFVRDRYIDLSKFKPGLAAFLLREVALRKDYVAMIEEMIRGVGFEILKSAPVPKNLLELVKAQFRGGNWALPAESGNPAHFILAFDRHPLPVDARQFVDAVATDNGRLMAKHDIRKKLAQLSKDKSLNALHSSDNSEAALEYVAILSPDMYATCKSLVEK
jgi:hypothetical protein